MKTLITLCLIAAASFANAKEPVLETNAQTSVNVVDWSIANTQGFELPPPAGTPGPPPPAPPPCYGGVWNPATNLWDCPHPPS